MTCNLDPNEKSFRVLSMPAVLTLHSCILSSSWKEKGKEKKGEGRRKGEEGERKKKTMRKIRKIEERKKDRVEKKEREREKLKNTIHARTFLTCRRIARREFRKA